MTKKKTLDHEIEFVCFKDQTLVLQNRPTNHFTLTVTLEEAKKRYPKNDKEKKS